MTRRTKEEIDTWLNDLYLEFRQNEIRHEDRILEVGLRINAYLNNYSLSNIPEKEYALKWMRNRCKPNCDSLPGSILAFYFDTEFWEIKIPLVYGNYSLDPLDYLNMPVTLKNILKQDPKVIDHYEKYWHMCFDFDYGLKEIPQTLYKTNSFATGLLLSGAQNLNAATAALLYTNHNNQVMMSIRMALEMFIKSYIVFHDHSEKSDYEKSEYVRKEIQHDLKKGLEKIQELSPNLINPKFFDILIKFPENIGKQRYSPENREIRDIAQCYDLTLRLGAIVTRSITDRNILNQ